MAVRGWYLDPHSGGNKVPEAVRQETIARLERYASDHFAGCYTRLDIRFRGPLCYIDAFREPDEPSPSLLRALDETRDEYFTRLRETPTHLCRLRFFARDRWSLAFFTYSNMRYTPCVFRSGSFFGTPEEALEIGGTYLRAR